jgi:hypothetical protein
MAEGAAKAIAGEAVSAAAAELAADRAAIAGVQAEMFDLPTSFTGEEAEAQRKRVLAVRAPGPGRPAGAENRSNRELREYLLKMGGHPLVNLMRWAMHTPETLSKELACTRLEAFDRLTSMWKELGPYFLAKQAPVDDAGKPVPWLNMMIGGLAGGVAEGRKPWEYMELETAEIRHSEAPQIPQSHGDQSHAEDNASENNGLADEST